MVRYLVDGLDCKWYTSAASWQISLKSLGTLLDTNGGDPVASSNKMMPSAQRSAVWLYSFSGVSVASSGAMYRGVPLRLGLD